MPATSVSTRPSISRVGTLPSGLTARKAGWRMSFLLNDIGLPSNGAPTSCRAICGAIELAPGPKYKVSIAVLPFSDHESTLWQRILGTRHVAIAATSDDASRGLRARD